MVNVTTEEYTLLKSVASLHERLRYFDKAEFVNTGVTASCTGDLRKS